MTPQVTLDKTKFRGIVKITIVWGTSRIVDLQDHWLGWEPTACGRNVAQDQPWLSLRTLDVLLILCGIT